MLRFFGMGLGFLSRPVGFFLIGLPGALLPMG